MASCGNENKDKSQPKIQGKLINYSDCKENENELTQSSYEIANNLSQVDYLYDTSKKTLTLKHINSAFNCCPDNLVCRISFENDTIIIEERENITEKCRCKCLYDLEILVRSVEPEKYSIKFIEPYYSGEEKIIFDIDLAIMTEGSFSVTRNEYPWSFE